MWEVEEGLKLTRNNTDAVVDDLIYHKFVATVGTLSPGRGKHPRLKVVDNPLRVLIGTGGDVNKLSTVIGFIWEDMVRQIIRDSSPAVAVCPLYLCRVCLLVNYYCTLDSGRVLGRTVHRS